MKKIATVLLTTASLILFSATVTGCSDVISPEEEQSSQETESYEETRSVMPIEAIDGTVGHRAKHDTGKSNRESSKSNRRSKGSRENRSGRSKSSI